MIPCRAGCGAGAPASCEGRSRRALVLPSHSHLRACGARNGPRFRATAAGASAPSPAACSLLVVTCRTRSGWPWRRCRTGDALICRWSRMPAKKKGCKLQASSDKPEGVCGLEACDLGLVALERERQNARPAQDGVVAPDDIVAAEAYFGVAPQQPVEGDGALQAR